LFTTTNHNPRQNRIKRSNDPNPPIRPRRQRSNHPNPPVRLTPPWKTKTNLLTATKPSRTKTDLLRTNLETPDITTSGKRGFYLSPHQYTCAAATNLETLENLETSDTTTSGKRGNYLSPHLCCSNKSGDWRQCTLGQNPVVLVLFEFM